MMAGTLVGRRQLLGVALVAITGAVAACGGDFNYKISGDRTESDERVISGEGRGTTLTQEQLLQLQADYAKKAEAARAAKSGG